MALLDLFKGRRLGRKRHEPPRDTIAFPNLIQPNGTQTSRKRLAFKPTPRNLRWFSLNPYARRAINALAAWLCWLGRDWSWLVVVVVVVGRAGSGSSNCGSALAIFKTRRRLVRSCHHLIPVDFVTRGPKFFRQGNLPSAAVVV
jgi:hypothetical protein